MKNQATQYLEFNRLEANPRLAGLLPFDMACRYHALPVAEDGARITVAMANPDNKEAREAILAVLGPSACVVRADAQVIDRLLAEFWEKASNQSLELLLWAPAKTVANEVETYAKDLATLLGAHLSQFETSKKGNQAYRALNSEIERIEADMLIFGAMEKTFTKRLIEAPTEKKLVDILQASLMVVRKPRWPLENILLVLRNESPDQSAIDWTVRIAQLSHAEVTVLPLTMPIPVMYDQIPGMDCSIAALLSSNCNLGKSLRMVARRLVDSEIKGTIRLRQEPLAWQIRFEVMERDYDLIVIACGSHNQLRRWLSGELINPLLGWAEGPVLVTKTSTV